MYIYFLGPFLAYLMYWTGYIFLRFIFSKYKLQKWRDKNYNHKNKIKESTIIFIGGMFWLVGLFIVIILHSLYK